MSPILKRTRRSSQRPPQFAIIILIRMKKYFFLLVIAGVVIILGLGLYFFSHQQRVPELLMLKYTLAAGDTIEQSLLENGIAATQIPLLTTALRQVFNPRLARVGDTYEVYYSSGGFWEKFYYYPQGPIYYEVIRSTFPGGLAVSRPMKMKLTHQIRQLRGTIQNSLWESMSSQQIPPEIIIRFAEIFSWQIDFFTDTRNNDEYRLYYEVAKSEEREFPGNILAAQYVSQQKTYTAIFYPPKNNPGAYSPTFYYDLSGESLSRAFLKAPLNYRRISSYFSRSRFHPILKIYRPHLGIDYAAPTGTPVSTIGDGTVTFAGWQGGFGRLVIVRHPNGYISSYGHLSRIARGISPGKKIVTGQLLGYVGATGLATGPHLDFRIKKDNRYINFLKMSLPAQKKIPESDWPDFVRTRNKYLQALSQIQ